MASGFMPALLLTEEQIFSGIINPAKKITPLGYLRMLLANGRPKLAEQSVENNGHTRTVTVKYRPRGVAGKSVTTDDCSIQGTSGYSEFTLPSLSFRKRGLYISYDEIRKYEQEASQTVLAGKPAPPMGVMMEMYNRIIENANGLLQDVDQDLLTQQAAAFGKNTNTGSTSATTINFPLDVTTNPLTQGWTKLMQDIMENEIRPDNAVIVGSGLINAVFLQMQKNTQNAKDQNYPNANPDEYWDWNTASKWGSNQFGVFEKGAVQFINVNKWDGNFGGDKLSSWLFTLNLPLADSLGNNELSNFKFDAQLRHIDCPQEAEIDGVVQTVDRGWIFDLMANYAQFNIPSDAYDAGDRLTGNNGTLRYVATNS